MNKNLFLIFISIFEIIRWISIYLFFNFIKNTVDPSSKIIGENILWFGTVVFINLLFSLSGIMASVNFDKYLGTLKFWYVFKLFFLCFIIFLLFYGVISLKTYFLLFAPFDFFIFLFLLLVTKEAKND
ncbi:MAG TPA: hypothetical protein PK771_05600 [Spirochaetota bacterium]|nr:hypothetical protein [Spirochaetota bacterium]